MLKLVSLALFGFIIWNLGRFIYLVLVESGMARPGRHGGGANTLEKDITGKARIIDEKNKNDR